MSFAEAARLASASGTGARGGGGVGGFVPRAPPQGEGAPAAFAAEVSAVARVAFQLSTQVTAFRRLVDGIGGPGDTKAHREKLKAARESVTRLAKDAGERLKKLPSPTPGAPGAAQQEAQREKLARDVRRLLADFEALVRDARAREARHAPREAQASAAYDAEGGREGAEEEERLLAEQRRQAQQEQEQVNSLIEHNDAIIAEREEGIQELQRDIGEVHEIFRDLAVLVHEQDAMIDSIDANIASTETRTGGGLKELERVRQSKTSHTPAHTRANKCAYPSRRRNRRRCCRRNQRAL